MTGGHAGRVVGLLGGSFNPAHGGHLHISRYALNSLKLDRVWWLVSPHNPLKDKDSLGDYAQRLARAREVTAGERRIIVSDIEAQKGLRYSYQTIRYLQKRYPGTCFVWLIGADNLAGFHRWRYWEEILRSIPVIIFDRAPFSHTAQRSKAYLRMRRFLLKDSEIIGGKAAPAMRFVHLRRDASSATELRKILGKKPILGHNRIMRRA